MIDRLERVACLVCGETKARHYLHKFGLDLVRCRACGLVYANPRLREEERQARYESPLFFDEYLRNFRATSEGYDPEYVRSHYRIYLDLLERLSSPGNKLLDVGCAAGFFVKAAEEAGWDAEGVEISKAASRYAREIVKAKIRMAWLEDAGFAPESFDVVTMFDLIEHLPEPIKTLREVFRVMKPGGRLIVSTPDLGSMSRRVLGKNWAVLSPAEHLANYDRRTLAAVFSKAGFRLAASKNLLILNPDYTNAPGSQSPRIFKKIHSRFERTHTADHLHGFEHLDLIHAEEPSRPHLAGLSPAKRLSRLAYLRAKRVLRGDILIAIAVKPAVHPHP